jgi:hypothetical protein
VQVVGVLSKRKDAEGQQPEHKGVEEAIEHDQPQHVAIPQAASSDWDLEVGELRWVLDERFRRELEDDPRVTAEASMPPEVVVLADDVNIGVTHLESVNADELVAVQPTRDQFVVDPGPVALSSDRPGSGGRNGVRQGGRKFCRLGTRGFRSRHSYSLAHIEPKSKYYESR